MIASFRDWFLDQLGLYAAYHADRRNRAFHLAGVPLIIFALLLALAQWRGSLAGIPFSAGTLTLGMLLAAYLVAAPWIGLMSVATYGPLYLLAEIVGRNEGRDLWIVGPSCFAAGWAFQFAGHICEGRRPAFTINILQVFIGPAFIIAEVAFAAGLQKNLAATLRARSQKFQPS